MGDLTAFDVAFRGKLTPRLSKLVKTAQVDGRVLSVSTISSAATVAERADLLGAEVIAVNNPQQRIVGYIFPAWVAKQVTLHEAPAITLTEAVRKLSRDPLKPKRRHFHEWLNFDRPEPRICPGNGKPHPTFFDPCLIRGHN